MNKPKNNLLTFTNKYLFFKDNNIMKKLNLSMLIVALVFSVFTSAASASSIIVQKGDSLWKIAQRYNVSFAEVLKLNDHFDNKHLIHPNDVVYIPDKNTGTSTGQSSASDNIAQGNASAIAGSVDNKVHEVLKIVNEERAKQGLKALTLSIKLTDIATEKARDMADNNYFSHTSPTYGTPFQMLQHFGVTYKTAGENIAAGQRSASEVMNSWLNSSGHRANILNSSYTEIGIGYFAGGNYGTEWVQLFIGK